MKYYRVKPCNDGRRILRYSKGRLFPEVVDEYIGFELFTEREVEKRGLDKSLMDVVEIPKTKVIIFFGVRYYTEDAERNLFNALKYRGFRLHKNTTASLVMSKGGMRVYYYNEKDMGLEYELDGYHCEDFTSMDDLLNKIDEIQEKCMFDFYSRI